MGDIYFESNDDSYSLDEVAEISTLPRPIAHRHVWRDVWIEDNEPEDSIFAVALSVAES